METPIARILAGATVVFAISMTFALAKGQRPTDQIVRDLGVENVQVLAR